MLKTILVTPEQLEYTANKIEDLAAIYKATYKRLYIQIETMESVWFGEDSKAFVAQITGFKDDFQKMHMLLLNYADLLRKSAKAYRETQNFITSEARKLLN